VHDRALRFTDDTLHSHGIDDDVRNNGTGASSGGVGDKVSGSDTRVVMHPATAAIVFIALLGASIACFNYVTLIVCVGPTTQL
jgi:hypothetical protein